jgi:hypothetical protein
MSAGLNPDGEPLRRRNPLLRMAVAAVVAAPLGYGVGMLLAKFGPDLGPAADVLDGLRWADVAAALLALVLAGAAVVAAAVSFSPRSTARMLGLDGDAGPDEIRSVRFQALVCILSAVVMVLPILLPALGISPQVAMALVAVLLVGHTLLNVGMWRSSDELVRAISVEAGAAVFWIGQGLLFLWGAAERLGVAPGLSAWDVYVVLMGLYLATAAIVTARRGLA